MKKTVFILISALITSFSFAQNAKFQQAMGQNLSKLAQAKTGSDYQALANQFERIANNETKEWLPLYYAAQTIILKTTTINTEEIDQNLDKAQEFIDKALKISENESELHVLQGWLHQMRIGVDPMNRGMKYSSKAERCFAKAEALNPENPRVFYLRAMSVLNTPEFAGGGKSNALPIFEKAKQKFDTFKTKSPLFPNWGASNNEEMIERCKS